MSGPNMQAERNSARTFFWSAVGCLTAIAIDLRAWRSDDEIRRAGKKRLLRSWAAHARTFRPWITGEDAEARERQRNEMRQEALT